jgi:hypothetical protein
MYGHAEGNRKLLERFLIDRTYLKWIKRKVY